jgi:hypothetical protein
MVYFDKPEDALRFTVALSALFIEDHSSEDRAKLAREARRVTRVTARGMLQPNGA